MAKKIYHAKRTSSFMPFDGGNCWVVFDLNGEIIHDRAGSHNMKQNEAIGLAKALNAGQISVKDIKETFCINR